LSKEEINLQTNPISEIQQRAQKKFVKAIEAAFMVPNAPEIDIRDPSRSSRKKGLKIIPCIGQLTANFKLDFSANFRKIFCVRTRGI